VTEKQLEVLRQFAKGGITEDGVKAKSSAVAAFVGYLHAVHQL